MREREIVNAVIQQNRTGCQSTRRSSHCSGNAARGHAVTLLVILSGVLTARRQGASPEECSGRDRIQVEFDKSTCPACPVRPPCISSATLPRVLSLLPRRELHEIQTGNRLEQQTGDWQQRYAIRAGIEAALSQNASACGLRRSHYRGLAGTHVQHALTAPAGNVTRIADGSPTRRPTAAAQPT